MTFTQANESVLEFYKELPFNIRQDVRDHAVSIVDKSVTDHYPQLKPIVKGTVIEIGCGVGWLSNSFAYHDKCTVESVDYNPVVIERAKDISEYMNTNVKFECADLFKWKPTAPADLVVSIGVLHHTNDCIGGVKRICNEMVKSGGHVFIGLYHKYGRKPFLDHFRNMIKVGCEEDTLYHKYLELDSRFNDETHSRSWFRDQVLHPHETQHTLEEMKQVLVECDMSLVMSDVPEDEESLYQVGVEHLSNNNYWPGFFTFLARKNEDTARKNQGVITAPMMDME
jgi:SAM-dependent methyltransferase